jgi:S1-C subfamily serine protease
MGPRRFLLLFAALAVGLASAGPARADHFGVMTRATPGGVEVVSLSPKGLAAQLGLTLRDVIQTVNDREVRTPEALLEALGPKNPNLTIRLLRSSRPETIKAEVFWPVKEPPKDASPAERRWFLSESEKRPPVVLKVDPKPMKR